MNANTVLQQKVKDMRTNIEKENTKLVLQNARATFNSKWSAQNVRHVGQNFHGAFAAGVRANAYGFRRMNLGQGTPEQKQARLRAMRRLKVKRGVHVVIEPTVKQQRTTQITYATLQTLLEFFVEFYTFLIHWKVILMVTADSVVLESGIVMLSTEANRACI